MPERDLQFDKRLAAIFKAEAAEHVQNMLANLAQLEGGTTQEHAQGAVRLLFRETHSLKGAARAVGKIEVESLCHAMESIFLALEHGTVAWSRELFDLLHDVTHELQRATAVGDGADGGGEIVPLLERLEAVIAADDASWRAAGAGPSLTHATAQAFEIQGVVARPAARLLTGPSASDTVRISVDRLSRLLYQVEELVSAKLAAHRQALDIDAALGDFSASRASRTARDSAHEARLKALKSSAGRDHRSLATAVDALLADVKKTLMLPVFSLTGLLSAIVRELSRAQGKEVDLKIEGGDLEMDRRLLEELRESLVHLLRNSVDHGIELPQQRINAGKPAQGTVTLSVVQKNSGTVVVCVSDDGAGIDRTRLAEAGLRLGLLTQHDADAGEVLPLIFAHGLSTARSLTEVSGRGIGLAIVHDKIEGLGGTISVESRPGQGTLFKMVLPLSLTTIRAVEIRTAGQSFLLPIAQVVRCARLAASDLRSVGARQTVPFGDEAVPLVALSGILELQPTQPELSREMINCLILESGGRRIAFTVDEVLGEQEVLSKPVEPRLTKTHAVSGAAVVRSGSTVAILNAASLIRSAVNQAKSPMAPSARPQVFREEGRSILLVEDSITSRTLLKNILEMAGHDVQVAVDGVQALEKLESQSFELVVTDVEMPNLDGFGLTEAIRRHPKLANLPVILVTSLSAPSDREKGAEAGANAYIVKSSFEQGDLLQAIRELI